MSHSVSLTDRKSYESPIKRRASGAFLLTALVLWVGFAESATGNYCGEILAELNRQEPSPSEYGSRERFPRVAKILEFLLRDSDQFKNIEPGSYSAFLRVAYPKEEGWSIHSYRQRYFQTTDPIEIARDDSRAVLQLPLDPQETVWAALSDEEKVELVERLARVFRRGSYDTEMSRGGVSDIGVALSFRAAIPVQPDDYHIWILPPWYSGISPRALLCGASQQCRVGVCRTINVALAGLLGELGIPNQDLHLVLGAREGDYHMWLEYRVGPSGEWREIDATGMSAEAQARHQRLAKAIFGDVIEDGAYIEVRSVGTLREKHPDDIRVIENFLRPARLKR